MRPGLTFILSLTVMALTRPAIASAVSFDQQMQPVLSQYLVIHKSLADDSTDGVKEAAAALQKAAQTLDSSAVTGEHAAHFRNLPKTMQKAAQGLTSAKDLEQYRDSLKAVSRPLAMWAGMAKPKGMQVMYCSMAKASWVQPQGPLANPYYGKSMLTCGEPVK